MDPFEVIPMETLEVDSLKYKFSSLGTMAIAYRVELGLSLFVYSTFG